MNERDRRIWNPSERKIRLSSKVKRGLFASLISLGLMIGTFEAAQARQNIKNDMDAKQAVNQQVSDDERLAALALDPVIYISLVGAALTAVYAIAQPLVEKDSFLS